MTREDIIRMAREAGFDPHDMSADFTCNLRDKWIAYAAAEVAAARDCRTCKHMVWDGEALCAQDVCTNADRYKPLPPVKLWLGSEV